MLSIYTLKSASDASKYYSQGDYYTGSNLENSLWLGKGSALLDLEGMVNPIVFEKLLKGHLPNGVVMIQVQKGEHHRPGYDLTFSAPKSVSLLALAAGNKEVLEAHRAAVQEVLLKIERDYAGVRDKTNGITRPEKVDNLIMALFEEYDSRAGDPQLHHHCVIMNIVQRMNGEWRTLYFDEVYRDKLLLGLAYRSALAKNLMALGYELVFKQGGLFEIKGVPEGMIQHFSKRRAEIKTWLEEHQLSGGLASKIANFETREAKVATELETRQARWLHESHKTAFSFDTLNAVVQEASIRGPVALPDLALLVDQAVELAIQHCAERNPTFGIKALINTARQFCLLELSDSDCLKAIEDRQEDQRLLYLGEGLLSGAQTKVQEQTIIASLKGSKNTIEPIISSTWVADFVVRLKGVQARSPGAALKFLLTNTHQQVLVEAQSKVVLRETLKAFNSACQDQKLYPCFLTERLSQVDPLKRALGTERVLTIEGFLMGCEAKIAAQNPNPGRLEQWAHRVLSKKASEAWVITSKIALSQMQRLQDYAKTLHARIVLTQTSPSHLPLIETLKEQGIHTISLSCPQHHEQSLKAQERILTRFDRLERVNAIVAIEGHKEGIALAAERSLQYKHPLVLTLGHYERLAVNEAVRGALIASDRLKGHTLALRILEPLGLSKAQKSQLASYQPGDVLRFSLRKQGRQMQADYQTVQSVDLERGLVLFEGHDASGWSPKDTGVDLKKMEVFKASVRTLCVGDVIAWTRTLRHPQAASLDRVTHQQARVMKVDERTHTVKVRLANGSTLKMDARSLQNSHWDYGYAALLKHVDCEKPQPSVVLLRSQKIEADTIQDLDQWFVQGQAHKAGVQIVCDNVAKLRQVVEQGGASKVVQAQQEVPYQRHEALALHQGTTTQLLFSGLQGEYLKVRELNPEFLPQNLTKEQPLDGPYKPDFRVACELVDWVCLYHAERDAVFNLRAVQKEALELGQGKVGLSMIENAFKLALEKGWLMQVAEEQGELLIATRHTVLLEKLCIHTMKQGQGQCTPLLSRIDAIRRLEANPKLTQGQREAIILLLSSTDRVTAVQGIAGVGKTTALKALRKECLALGFEPLVLANTGNAKNQAEQVSGMASMTTTQFLTEVPGLLARAPEKAQKDFGKHKLIILDEASMASTRDLFQLQKIVTQLGVQLDLTGDIKQQGSFGAGVALEAVLGYGVSHAVMKENVRLKSETAFEVMKKAYAGDMRGSLEALKDRIEEIPVKEEALERIVELYMDFIHTGKEPPLVITPLNKDRFWVNCQIREHLKAAGKLGARLQTPVLLPTNRREIEKGHIRGFGVGEVIRFNSHNPRLGIQAGDYWEVAEIDEKHHRLTLKTYEKTGLERILYWSPKDLDKPSSIEIYGVGKRELSVNDCIVFKRNQPAKGIFNGDKATVVDTQGEHLSLRLVNGTVVTLNLHEAASQHLDYGYALTVYQAQSRDVPFVIAYGEGPQAVPRLESQLKLGDTLILPKTKEDEETSEPRRFSKVVRVVAKDHSQLTLVDRKGHRYQESCDAQRKWDYFPPIKMRSKKSLPLTTSQKGFIVQVTRGDYLWMVVSNIFDFQKTLEAHAEPKRSALSYLDARWPTLKQGVQRLTKAIQWYHAPKEQQADKVRIALKPKHSGSKSRSQGSYKKDITGNRSSRRHFIDCEALVQSLKADPLHYASQWLGLPSKVVGRDARWKGTLSVTIKGEEAGRWRQWSSGEGGRDLISLYSHAHNVDWKTALKELGKSLSLDNSEASTQPRKSKMQSPSPQQDGHSDLQRIEKARALYQKGVPIAGTLAEKYLREHRGIQGDLPEDFRFVKSIKHFQTQEWRPALVAPLWDKENRLTGLTRIFLNRDGSKYEGFYQDDHGQPQKANPKISLGVLGQSAVVVQEGIDPTTVWVAEGIETALSVAQAMPHQTVMATLSVERLKNIAIKPGVEKVVICADHDGVHANSYNSVIEAVGHHLSKVSRVFMAMPSAIAGMDKVDFNDLLKQGGVASVKQILDKKIEIRSMESLNRGRVIVRLPECLDGMQTNTQVQTMELQSKDLII